METDTREPFLGEIRAGRRLSRNQWGRYLYTQCPVCKQNRWVHIQTGRMPLLCKSCRNTKYNKEHSGIKSHNWKGGRTYNLKGYVKVICPNGHKPLQDGYILEHRLAWELSHGKQVPDGYAIHHLNGIKDDNRSENLIAISKPNHTRKEMGEVYKKRTRVLEKEIQKLKLSLENKQLIWTGENQ